MSLFQFSARIMENGRTDPLPVSDDCNRLLQQQLRGFLVSHRVPARWRIAAHRPFHRGTPAPQRGFSKPVEDSAVAADEISITVEPLALPLFVKAVDFDSRPKRTSPSTLCLPHGSPQYHCLSSLPSYARAGWASERIFCPEQTVTGAVPRIRCHFKQKNEQPDNGSPSQRSKSVKPSFIDRQRVRRRSIRCSEFLKMLG
jgi:hypothetical protein